MRRIVSRIWPHSQTWRAAVVAAFILSLIIFLFTRLTGDWSVLTNVKNLTDVKDLAGIFQSAVTIIAIVIGGVFAWFKLQAFRDFEPHLTVTHEIGHRPIGTTYTHIDVTAVLHNSSKVNLGLREAVFRLQRIGPTTDEEIESLYAEVFESSEHDHLQWPTLEEVGLTWESGELVIEPGESHRETYEFIISSDVQVVLVYTFFENPHASNRARSADGWGATTICDTVLIDE